ncbi:hypothetical protein PybrP1_012395 [[Pythium] brassicae (nom. inval.)]|nr:hypothetical protein PybrP1_012395 [[Pythium] brassicae (nom. inval.)]
MVRMTTTVLIGAAISATLAHVDAAGEWSKVDVTKDNTKTLLSALGGGDGAYSKAVGAMRVCFTAVAAVEQQVVSGMNYRFHVDGCKVETSALAGECAKDACAAPARFVVRVYEQVWTNTLEVTAIEKEGDVKPGHKPESVLASIKAAPVVDDTEKRLIDKWITATDRNQYGDAKHTMYTGGTPLFDEATGVSVDRYDYIATKHPERPWAEQVVRVQLAAATGAAAVKGSTQFVTIIASVGVLTVLFALVAGVKVKRSRHRLRRSGSRAGAANKSLEDGGEASSMWTPAPISKDNVHIALDAVRYRNNYERRVTTRLCLHRVNFVRSRLVDDLSSFLYSVDGCEIVKIALSGRCDIYSCRLATYELKVSQKTAGKDVYIVQSIFKALTQKPMSELMQPGNLDTADQGGNAGGGDDSSDDEER